MEQNHSFNQAEVADKIRAAAAAAATGRGGVGGRVDGGGEAGGDFVVSMVW